MVEQNRSADNQTIEFDISKLQATEQDWSIIKSSKVIENPSERCYFIGDLAILDPQCTIAVPTREDWQWFNERTAELNEPPKHSGVTVRNPLIREMAKVNREIACKAF